jgi:ubiquinone/menaquinone biosynthesis C-methylase UbiE
MARSGHDYRSGRHRGGDGSRRFMRGGGWFTMPIGKIAGHVTAIDIDGNLLDMARARLAEAGIANCDLVEGEAHDVGKLVARPVDFVFLANVFHGVTEKTSLASAVAKALGPRGHFAIVNWHARPREDTTILGEPRGPATKLRMTPEATRAAVEPAGFRLQQVVELPPYHYGAVFEKS